MKLPWQHNSQPQDEGKTGVKPSDKATVARLKASGDEGTLVLSTDNLVKKYRQRTVVNHVSINVHQGEIVGLLGPNGAGKTTTFYMTTCFSTMWTSLPCRFTAAPSWAWVTCRRRLRCSAP